MKNLYYKILQAFFNRPSSQEELIDFINDKANVQKAVEGSMQKRLDLIERVRLHKKRA